MAHLGAPLVETAHAKGLGADAVLAGDRVVVQELMALERLDQTLHTGFGKTQFSAKLADAFFTLLAVKGGEYLQCFAHGQRIVGGFHSLQSGLNCGCVVEHGRARVFRLS